MMDKIILEIKRISKSFTHEEKQLQVLSEINFSVIRGEILCLLGHSGCGKTTLLRIISRIIDADKGVIFLEGTEVKKPSKDVLLLFQDFNQLFPWMTVKQNVVHALLVTGTVADRSGAERMAIQVLTEVGLLGFENTYPYQLSGGMNQRAAVARALALHPKVILMDEAFASLDYATRKKLQVLLREKVKQYGITVIFVTHSIEEAVLVGDRIALMKPNPGEIGKIMDNYYLYTSDNEKKLLLIDEIMQYMDRYYL